MLPFYVKENKAFDVQITVDGEIQDISGDSVTCIFKTDKSGSDADAPIKAIGNVSSKGAQGIAEFNLPKEDTDVDPGAYFWEIKWTHGDAVNIIASSTVKIKDRVYD